MADNYIENCLEKFEIRKQAYLKKKKTHLPKSMLKASRCIAKDDGEMKSFGNEEESA